MHYDDTQFSISADTNKDDLKFNLKRDYRTARMRVSHTAQLVLVTFLSHFTVISLFFLLIFVKYSFQVVVLLPDSLLLSILRI